MNSRTAYFQTTILIGGMLLTVPLGGQTSASTAKATPPDKVETYKGCVTEIPTASGNFVLATADRCFLLDSPGAATKLLGHEVTLKGALAEASGMLPETLHVRSTTSIGSSCAKACTLPPPGSRGVHGSERPGHEGSTPGEKPTGKPTPQS